MGAGTTVRFVLLVILVLVTSGFMMLQVAYWLSNSDDTDCSLAAGIDPNHSTGLAIGIARLSQMGAYEACVARYAAPPPWWVPMVWPVVVLVIGVVLFLSLPAWKARRGRVIPVDAIDHDGDLRLLLADLTAIAGLAHTPRFVVDPATASTGAVVFGRNRRPTVCLHGGLLARRRTDPDGFRAVLLHELAHIRNGDVTLTYLTVAVWRVFLAMVLPPYLVLSVRTLSSWVGSPFWSSGSISGIRSLLVTVVMGTLVYLARADVLRSREIYADLAAVRWGADPHGWAVETPQPAGSTLSGAFASFVELWRTHPRWDLRRGSLSDPAALFGIQALPMFLTGAAATLINVDLNYSFVQYGLSGYGLLGEWARQAAALATAALVAGVAGIAMWRAVARAALTARPVPSGVRAGLWLGAGMAATELVTNQVSTGQWLPAHPEALVLVVLAGAVFTWWVTQCALLWVRTWRGRTIRPAMLLGLTSACLALSCWFGWWETGGGAVLTAGWPFTLTGVHQLLGQALGGSSPGHPAAVSAITVAFAMTLTILSNVLALPLALVAVAALWVAPLLAWLIRPTTAAPRWVRDALRDSGNMAGPVAQPLPSLRRVLLPGLLGGVLCWAVVAGVRTYLHSWPPPASHQAGDNAMRYLAWVTVAVVATSMAAAVTANALTSRYRLVIALIAAETATLVGFVGASVLVSFDGCFLPPNAWPSCGWHPVSPWLTFHSLLPFLLAPTLALSAIVAVAVAAAVAVLGRTGLPWPPPSAPTHPDTSRAGLAVRRLCVGVLCAAALAVAATDANFQAHKNATPFDPARVQQTAQQVLATADTQMSAETKAMQVDAWSDYGGDWLMQHVATDWDHYVKVVHDAVNSGHTSWPYLRRQFRPICADFSRLSRIATGYFRVPDPQAQTFWQQVTMQTWKGGQDCEQALHQRNLDLFTASFHELNAAAVNSKSTSARIEAVRRNGRPTRQVRRMHQ